MLGSGRNAVRYQMVGHGVSPIFTTSGLVDSSELNGEGRIDIGDVLQGGSIELPFTLSNNSPFEVSYSVDLTNAGELNRSGVQVCSGGVGGGGDGMCVCVCVCVRVCVCVCAHARSSVLILLSTAQPHRRAGLRLLKASDTSSSRPHTLVA